MADRAADAQATTYPGVGTGRLRLTTHAGPLVDVKDLLRPARAAALGDVQVLETARGDLVGVGGLLIERALSGLDVGDVRIVLHGHSRLRGRDRYLHDCTVARV